MAMQAEALAEIIYAKMEAKYWPAQPLPPGAEAATKEYYTVLADAWIEFVMANMDVLPGSFANAGGNVSGTGKVK